MAIDREEEELLLDPENPAEEQAEALSQEEAMAVWDEEDPEAAAMEQQMMLVTSLAEAARQMVKEARDARDASGVERRWDEDRANYYGADFEFGDRDSVVDRASENTGNAETKVTKSRIGVNITRPKVNTATSRLIDMKFPTDERNWKLQPTPNPSLSSKLNDQTIMTQGGKPLMKKGENGQLEPVRGGDVAKQEMQEAERSANAMQREIDDQLVECDFVGEARKAVSDEVLLGTGIMCGPVPRQVEKKAWIKGEDGRWVMQLETKLVPYSRRVNPLDAFPDPAGQGDIKKCRYFVERFYYNTKTLSQIKGDPGALDPVIDQCIKEGPTTVVSGNDPHTRRFLDGDYELDSRNLFEAFLVTGMFPIRQLEAAGVEIPEELLDRDNVSGCVLLVNDKPVKVYLNPLDSGDLPYDMFHYERIDGQPWGVGVAFIVRNPQRVVRAAWRMLMDNAANNIGGQIIINRQGVTPANGSWKMTGGKIWWFNPQAGQGQNLRVEDVFRQWNADSRISELLKIIEFAMKFAEDESSMPALLEGNQGKASPTATGMQLLDSNANTVLMRLVRQGEDLLIKPHLRRYYDYNMQWSENEDVKGDFDIVPLSVSALRQKTLDIQGMMLVGQHVAHPAFAKFHKSGGYDWLRRFYSLNRINPDDVLISPDDAEQALKAEAEKGPPPDPRLIVADLNAKVKGIELDQARAEAAEEREHRKNEKMLDYQMTLLRYATQRQISLEQAQKEFDALVLKIEHEERMQQREALVKGEFGSGL